MVRRIFTGQVNFFMSSRRRHTRCYRDWSSDVCSSDLWVKDGMVIAQSATLTVADIPAVPTLTSLNPASVVAGTGAVTVHVGGSEIGRASCREGEGDAGGAGEVKEGEGDGDVSGDTYVL